MKHGKLDVIKQKLQQRSEEISATIDEMSVYIYIHNIIHLFIKNENRI